MQIDKYEFGNECPTDCKGKNEPIYQGNLCSRCPIFNCTPIKDIGPMVEPKDYNVEWAGEFYNFIYKGGDRPKLYLPNKS